MQPELAVETMNLAELVPYAGNAKEHPEWQIDQIAESIGRFGMCDPIGIWHDGEGRPVIVEGHGRVLALERLGVETAPVITLDHLTDEERRAYANVHNQLTMNTGFDMAMLEADLADLPEFDWQDYGFDWQDYSEDEFGVGFELPDGDAPQCRSMTLRLTQEQFEAVEAAVAAVDETTMEGGSETGRKVAEVCRQWAGL